MPGSATARRQEPISRLAVWTQPWPCAHLHHDDALWRISKQTKRTEPAERPGLRRARARPAAAQVPHLMQRIRCGGCPVLPCARAALCMGCPVHDGGRAWLAACTDQHRHVNGTLTRPACLSHRATATTHGCRPLVLPARLRVSSIALALVSHPAGPPLFVITRPLVGLVGHLIAWRLGVGRIVPHVQAQGAQVPCRRLPGALRLPPAPPSAQGVQSVGTRAEQQHARTVPHLGQALRLCSLAGEGGGTRDAESR